MASNYEDRTWESTDGLNLHYRDYAGPDGVSKLPVICLHGLTRNARDFADLGDRICAERRVIVPEMRGRGMSDYAPDSGSYNPMQYVADVEKLLAEQRIDQFVSIGTSMGGLMTMLMAQLKPGRIKAVVLNDIGPQIEIAGIERIAGYVGQGRSYPTWMHAARSLRDVHSAAFPDFDLDQWLSMAKKTLVVSQSGRIIYDYDMKIAEPFKQPGNAAPPDLWPAFEALAEVPMLLIKGDLSDLISPETVKRMRELNPSMTMITIARVGHAPTLEEADAQRAIAALLAGVA